MEIAPTPATPAARQSATLFVALELSRAKWLVGLHSPVADKISRRTVTGGDAAALLAVIDEARRRVRARLGGEVAVAACYEAGYDGFWLHRLLLAHGIASHVVDPASLLVNRRARRRKTDAIDLAGLLRTLMAWHRGERQVCSMVRVPGPEEEEEDRRRRGRERERLIKERVQHLGRIKGLLMAQGVRDFQPTRGPWRDRLDALRTGDGRPLPSCLKAEIARECRRLALVDEMLAELERERDAEREGAAPGQVALLTKLRGVGPASAHLLAGEVFHRDFANRRQVAGYLGLEPSPWQSGKVEREQGISKAGNRRARRVAIELAWLWLQYQPDSRLSRWFQDRVGAAKGRVRRPGPGGGAGAQAGRGALALPGRGRRAGRSADAGLKRSRATAVARDDPGWTCDRSPFGFSDRRKDGSRPPGPMTALDAG